MLELFRIVRGYWAVWTALGLLMASLLQIQFGWLAPFWCWVTAYQTLVGALIAGTMTLGGGYLAYKAAVRQTDEAWRIENENHQKRKSAVASHCYMDILKGKMDISNDRAIRKLDEIITMAENDDDISAIINKFKNFRKYNIPKIINISVNDRVYIGVETSNLIDVCNQRTNYIEFIIETATLLLIDESIEEMKIRQMEDAKKLKEFIIDSIPLWNELFQTIEAEIHLGIN